MTGTMLHPDFTHARNLMVDGQLRPTNVNDQRVLDAMRALPRERFVPSRLAGLAYIDDDLEIAPGRFMLKPLVLARLMQSFHMDVAGDRGMLPIGRVTTQPDRRVSFILTRRR